MLFIIELYTDKKSKIDKQYKGVLRKETKKSALSQG
jgi:hypothetical protein